MDWELLPEPVRARLVKYFEAEGVTEPCRVDAILGLLRLNDPDSLKAAEGLAGVRIARCPPALPPWPPKPVLRKAAAPTVASKADPNPCQPSTDMHYRFSRIRQGMTHDQLARLGLSKRDVRYLTKQGRITWTA